MTEFSSKLCQSVEIQFENLSYQVKTKGNSRKILRSLNGSFCAGNLIGILGPSGAGKTSLLNVLAGHINEGVSGNIKINGVQRDLKKFQKLSCYIMQEDIVQKQLTVEESMDYAARLKLPSNINNKEKKDIVDTVLETLGIENARNTRTENLSGGQRKRVAIALELINNPPVLFFDEPTTGLDNVGAKQCILLLKELARHGRTVICTIHQPSDVLFNFFDQVYFMSDGLCIYNGSVNVMVPFLQKINTPCPANSSPADYLIELSSAASENTRLLSKATGNGKTNHCNTELSEKFISKSQVYNTTTHPVETNDSFQYPIQFISQVYVILSRMFLQLGRNKIMLSIQVTHHLVCALVVGISFLSVGNDATQAIANFKFLIGMILFYAYTHIMSPILLYPFELQLVKREYSNHWYSLKAYYTALTISTLPLMIALCLLYNTITYIMTDQPVETMRFIYFNVITIIISLSSYGVGLAIGSTFRPTMGAVIGSALGVCLLLIGMYGMGYGNSIEPIMKFFMFLDYLRHGLEALCLTLLKGRPLLNCDDEIYCHLRNPEDMLHLMGMGKCSMEFSMIMSGIYLILIRTIAYMALRRVVKPSTPLVRRCL